ncbi:hypothetical protein BSL82_15630 [Tardibacter chloracetimidivorans]|uniref:Uncharacterized protein n=1 Tax=Tardibacter chloracetimidivorans TaxID=1921510 RepID=A0A1L3ZY47_9SPHN|nr:hypothetical protein [Tardibacter chloracetimidivorans]API60535.1 hypothetical protein BSL82_15630 [Tardibacter chloracetimidivorans]
MQLCNVEVRLGDSAGHTVRKSDVTPAEILVLRAIHGESAVVDINPTKMSKRAQHEEWDRLQRSYGRTPAGLTDAGNGSLLEKLFPGAQKNLPVSLKDIGLAELMNPHRERPEVVDGADA